MPGRYCVAINCKNRGGFQFPKNQKLRKRWVNAVRRKNFKPSNFSVLCADHFLANDIVTKNVHGLELLRKKLKEGAVPSVFKFQPNEDVKNKLSATNRATLALKRKEIEERREIEREKAYLDITEQLPTVEVDVYDSGTDTDTDDEERVYYSTTSQTIHTGPFAQCTMSIESLQHSEKFLHFFTGLERADTFFLVYNSLEIESCPEFQYFQNCKLNMQDQFLLVLMKLRCYKCNLELSFNFNISESLVSKIVNMWIRMMFRVLSNIDTWPSKELVQQYMPRDFKRKFPTTRVILDGTEIPIKKPSDSAKQQATFSPYKNRNTLKVVIGCSPGGMITFISNTYGGAASDRQIVERSDLMSKCTPGDSILADRGFNVQDIFAPYGVAVNIPTFMKGKNQLPGLTVKYDRKISSKRVHIERVIGLVKTFKILQIPLNRYETEIGHEIIYICCILCNFRHAIVDSFA